MPLDLQLVWITGEEETELLFKETFFLLLIQSNNKEQNIELQTLWNIAFTDFSKHQSIVRDQRNKQKKLYWQPCRQKSTVFTAFRSNSRHAKTK